jgi:rhamnulokinase
MREKRYYLAVDIGASSGRHILGHVAGGRLVLREVYRFDNGMVSRDGRLCWDTETLFAHTLEGLRACKKIGCIPETMGIDTWGVDFALLDKDDKRIGDVVAYRDKRTEGVADGLEHLMPFTELYTRTGIQKQPFNTIYQLRALKRDSPRQLEHAESLLLLPDYFGFLLTGMKKQEYTNATTTALVNCQTRQWDTGLIEKLGLPKRLFGALSMPKTTVGSFKKQVAETVGFDCRVVLPATHDTGSAFLAVPAEDAHSVYLSSGTWSLLGAESKKPIVTPAGRSANFTNEGGFDGRFRYLKNIMGLWMLQSIRSGLNNSYTYPELAQLAMDSLEPDSVIDVNAPCFLAPDSMSEAVRHYCAETGQPVPRTTGEILRVIYRSLAESYAEAIHTLSAITGRHYTRIHIVGGGSRDAYLNQLTASASGLPVSAGPVECTALGNLLAQMLAADEFESISAARAAITRSFEITAYKV